MYPVVFSKLFFLLLKQRISSLRDFGAYFTELIQAANALYSRALAVGE